MKKQLYCLFPVLVLAITLRAATDTEDYAACCKPPASVTFNCNQLPYGFDPYNIHQLQSLFGKAENKCYHGAWTELPPIVQLSNCKTGKIIRRFQVTAHYTDEVCEQVVTIVGVHNYAIRFPADVESSCGVVPPIEQLQREQSSCDLLAISVTEQNFIASGSQCGKIFRTYRVINWCEYDGYSPPVVISRDEDCDGKPGDEAVWVIRRPNGSIAFIDRDNNETNHNPQAGERITCHPSNPRGYWRTVHSTGLWEYTQHIKVNDYVPPSISITQPQPICSYSNTCDVLVDIPFSVSDDCTPHDIKIKVFIDGVKIAEYPKGGDYSAKGRYAIGNHKLEIHAIDGCGNPNVKSIHFTIVDCKAPAPICINGITATLMPLPPNTDIDGDGEADPAAMEIWASDLLISQTTDCSGISGFSINRVGERPNRNKTNLILTCKDLGRLHVEIYAWDNANNPYAVQPNGSVGGPNYSHCKTYILVQARDNLCPPLPPLMANVAGRIFTEDSIGLQGVQIQLIGTDSSMRYSQIEGTYRFDDVPMVTTYNIVPSLDSNALEGLSIGDLIVLQRHILGLDTIISSYRLIAADINRDGEISNADVIELRQMLLGLHERFPNNTNWRFIDAAFTFPNPRNPWQTPFPEFVRITNMERAAHVGNFVAVKIGDVNNSLMNDRRQAALRSGDVVTITIPDRELHAGEQVEIPIRLYPEMLQGLQMALFVAPDAAQIIQVQSATEDVTIWQNNASLLRALWSSPEPSQSEVQLFTIRLQAQRKGWLSELLQLHRSAPTALAYDHEGATMPVRLVFERDQNEAFALYQNQPNPFRDETLIRFRLPEANQATLRVFDAQGRLLWQVRGDFAAGHNEIRLQRNDISAKGLLFYRLETQGFQATRYMILQ